MPTPEFQKERSLPTLRVPEVRRSRCIDLLVQPDRSYGGDWYCTALSCGAHNYASRTNCYRCGTIKNDYGGYSMMGSESSVPPGWKTGDWMCTRYGCGSTTMLAGWSASNARHQGTLGMPRN
ncbi:Zinc finger family protein, putative isoform 1 [Hibiscus syriacus]|uniref:Zinc finger family protein, putative isoform 1 n=1 Tax=Hibiscus syriacus TaxID=106335 RepID=A0A6A3D7X6_HIBSY|nr:uncharacterized protein LOC120201649 [Hibiscus syriacus]KAE8735352.1 Zinc finger family protein, putative isoform 1 [Hibiscus syriacus]